MNYTNLIERVRDQRDRDAAEHCPAEIIELQDEVIAALIDQSIATGLQDCELEALRASNKILVAQRKIMREALEYYRDECTGHEPSLSVFQLKVDEALTAAKAAGELHARDAVTWMPETGYLFAQQAQAPYANCRFKICDLPGQCKGEGKCHHPAVPQAQQAQEPVGVVDECDDGLFVDLETKNGVMVRRGDLVYTHPAPKQAEPSWQPIETAPKDGTVIDLWHEEFGRWASCNWGLPDHTCGEMGSLCDSDVHSMDEGWVTDLNEITFPASEYTHWMPLPKPPEAQ